MKKNSSTRAARVAIDCELVLASEVRRLTRSCRIMRRLHGLTGAPPLRYYGAGLPGLARIVVGQQLSLASAEAIWQRLLLAVVPLDPRGLLTAAPETLRAAGLSGAKIATLKALAEAVSGDGLDLAGLDRHDDAAVRERLTAIRGIGPWTADIFLLFCLGRADAFASADLALQVAVQRVLELDARPSPRELEVIAERWRPRRAVAARLLWAYYGLSKGLAGKAPL